MLVKFMTAVLLGNLVVQLACAEPLLFVGSQFPLIAEQDAKGHFHGLAVDVINTIMQDSAQPFQIILVPWKRAQSMLKSGEADVLIGPYKTLERQRYIDYPTTPFYSDYIVFYSLKGREFNWQGDYLQLSGKVIGVPLGWTGGEAFEFHRPSMRIYEVPELKNGFEMLLRKRIDLVLSNRRNALATLDELQILQQVIQIEPVLQTIQGYFGFAKLRDLIQLKTLFERRLREMQQDGSLLRLNQQYGLEYTVQNERDSPAQ